MHRPLAVQKAGKRHDLVDHPHARRRFDPVVLPEVILVLGELLFALLPFGVLFIVFAYQGRQLASYLMAPEWAFASSILKKIPKTKTLIAVHNNDEGKLSIHMVRYEDLVDLILPDDFIFSKPYVKKIIAKAAAIEFSNEIATEVNFDIELTDKGITLGRVNLFDLKRE